MMDKNYYTYKEVCAILKISRFTLYDLVKDGSLKTVTVGKSKRITDTALDEYLKGE